MSAQAKVRFINRAPQGYSQVVEARGGRTLYVAGQIAVDKEGKLVGPGDFRAQVKQVFENLKARLEEGGASKEDPFGESISVIADAPHEHRWQAVGLENNFGGGVGWVIQSCECGAV